MAKSPAARTPRRKRPAEKMDLLAKLAFSSEEATARGWPFVAMVIAQAIAEIQALRERLAGVERELAAARAEPPSPCAECGNNQGPSPYSPQWVLCAAAGGVSHDPASGCGAYRERSAACVPPATPRQERCPGCINSSSPVNEPPCLDCNGGQNFTQRRVAEVPRG